MNRLVTAWIASLLFSPAVFADKPVIRAITGVSSVKMADSPVAFGGFGGAACVGPDLNSTCDSCAGAGLAACNSTRAYNALQFHVSATHRQSGNLILVRADKSVLSEGPHNAHDVSVSWSDICGGMTGGVSDCETTPAREGYVQVCLDANKNNTLDSGEDCQAILVNVVQMAAGAFDKASDVDGITDFVLFPGNGKVFFEELLASANFPYLSHGGKITAVRIYASEQGMSQAAPGSGMSPVDRTLLNDNSLAHNYFDGLTNGRPYWFRIGLVDEANNVGYFWPPVSYVDPNGHNCDIESCIFTQTPARAH
jgi:hypothetical protein